MKILHSFMFCSLFCLVGACGEDLRTPTELDLDVADQESDQSAGDSDVVTQDFGDFTAYTTLSFDGSFTELVDRDGATVAVLESPLKAPFDGVAVVYDIAEEIEVQLEVSPDEGLLNEIVYDIWNATREDADEETYDTLAVEDYFTISKRGNLLIKFNGQDTSASRFFCYTTTECRNACEADGGQLRSVGLCYPYGATTTRIRYLGNSSYPYFFTYRNYRSICNCIDAGS